ncbi:MAG TPA: dual specificity protein phosphatase family protein [Polyangiaceae bacterium]|nr:dual specificity protein phosphatase family protein [Polyangiaceae bacterium]
MRDRLTMLALSFAVSVGLYGCGAEQEWGSENDLGFSTQSLSDGSIEVNPQLKSTRRGSKHYEDWVSASLARGDQPTGQEILDLKQKFGFKSIVNLRLESNFDEAYAVQAKLNYLRLPIVDVGVPTQEQMVNFLDFVTDPANQPAFVHCKAGINRTGLAVGVYRMAVDGWSAEEALSEAKTYGFGVPAEVKFVKAFGNDLSEGKIDGYPLVSD